VSAYTDHRPAVSHKTQLITAVITTPRRAALTRSGSQSTHRAQRPKMNTQAPQPKPTIHHSR